MGTTDDRDESGCLSMLSSKNGSLLVPAPPTDICPDTKPEKLDQPKRSTMTRTGFGTSGRQINLLANHFRVSVKCPYETFFQYSVTVSYEDKSAVNGRCIGRKVIDKLYQAYSSEFSGKRFAYDGEKCLYTVGPLPQNNMKYTVVLEEATAKHRCLDESVKRSKCSFQPKTFIVEITYAAKIPLDSLSHALEGADPEPGEDAVRVLDIILRQRAANRGCLLVGQSFFSDDSRLFSEIGGGVTGCRGFHSSFRPTHGGLTLNMDVSNTVILTPGPVIDFLLANQGIKERHYIDIDWARAKKTLKNMRVKARHSNMEYKITGLSELPCHKQVFSMKKKNEGGSHDDGEVMEISVYDYFTKLLSVEVTFSAFMPCVDVGKPKKPIYLPMELCSLVSLQRYKTALSFTQRASLVESSRQKPSARIQVVVDSMRSYCYDDDPVLAACGISIEKQLMPVEGRILDAPKLKIGNGEDCFPRNGRWNFNNKQFLTPSRVERWSVVNFSARCDTSHLSRELISCARNKGIHMERPHTLVEEDPQYRRSGPIVRVEKMFELIMSKIPGPPQLLLCVLPERKNSNLYGPWKKKCLVDFGIVTQCVSPTKITDNYLTNVLLKINAKLGGSNSMLAIEKIPGTPINKDTPTMILGIDVSHGSPGQSDSPSIAAVVGSRHWPLISKYRAAVRTQSSRVEMVETLYKPLADGEDDGIMRELLVDFYQTSNGCKPAHIIVFRDGVSESQFSQVLNIEVDQMIKAYKHLGEVDVPKFTVIVAQKNHHTRLFQAGAPENVPPGIVVDTKIVHPRCYDFYMCAHTVMMGTARPAHYHVLCDEIGFSPDDLQNLIHSLCYVHQRSTTATSIVAPIYYAHLAARQVGQFINFDETSSLSITSVPELPMLHEEVEDSMFFC
ncbi:unnamed protein product [Cuscuta epithymum]|uniref:Uncharacterized protein n=1 Tax=Cuscuta epithymum TaxID=186058 RepID=A0AAV0GDN2_9ASTE|nr:unnamed protein product [Cuscuta epithymum]CAH9146042.1 unnamed protein product [Cuscuta epithymum]